MGEWANLLCFGLNTECLLPRGVLKVSKLEFLLSSWQKHRFSTFCWQNIRSLLKKKKISSSYGDIRIWLFGYVQLLKGPAQEKKKGRLICRSSWEFCWNLKLKNLLGLQTLTKLTFEMLNRIILGFFSSCQAISGRSFGLVNMKAFLGHISLKRLSFQVPYKNCHACQRAPPEKDSTPFFYTPSFFSPFLGA